MKMGEIIRQPRRIGEPMVAQPVKAPILAPIFTTPERETVPVRRKP